MQRGSPSHPDGVLSATAPWPAYQPGARTPVGSRPLYSTSTLSEISWLGWTAVEAVETRLKFFNHTSTERGLNQPIAPQLYKAPYINSGSGWRHLLDVAQPLLLAPDTRAGGGTPAMESLLSTFATCGFGVCTLLEAYNRLSCPRSADTALETLNLQPLLSLQWL